jgi:hypothetical protein
VPWSLIFNCCRFAASASSPFLPVSNVFRMPAWGPHLGDRLVFLSEAQGELLGLPRKLSRALLLAAPKAKQRSHVERKWCRAEIEG